MSELSTLVETKGPPPKPSRDELRVTLQRYADRIPAQDFRVAKAEQEHAKAAKILAAAQEELDGAIAARSKLDALIAEYTEQVKG